MRFGSVECIISCFYFFSSWRNRLFHSSYLGLSCDHGLHCSDDLVKVRTTTRATTTTQQKVAAVWGSAQYDSVSRNCFLLKISNNQRLRVNLLLG